MTAIRGLTPDYDVLDNTGSGSIQWGNQSFTDINLTSGSVDFVLVSNGGTGYSTSSPVTFSAPPTGGTTATGTVLVSGSAITGVAITNPGSGYTSPPTVTFGPGGATAIAVMGHQRPAEQAATLTTLFSSGDPPARIAFIDDRFVAIFPWDPENNRQTHPCLLYTSPSPRD